MSGQIKSKKRVANYGEVFTAEREVNAMLDLVKSETDRVESKFLEPACGNGNFLVEILRRKLNAAKKQSTSPSEYELLSMIAVASIYGIELLNDNVKTSRKRMFEIWDKEYSSICEDKINQNCRNIVKIILSRNIIRGNTLSTMCVDENGKDTDRYITFTDWTFISSTNIQSADYRLKDMIHDDETQKTKNKKRKVSNK